MRTITYPKTFTEWRDIARRLLAAELPPAEVLWQASDQGSLFGEGDELPPTTSQRPQVSKLFVDLARTAATHRSGEQWAVLYSLIWRLTHGERHVLTLRSDPEVASLMGMVKHIGRDIHKMHAFVRFRKVGDCEARGREQFVSWFEPEHLIVRLTTSFFRKRFAGMDWSILTPDECMHWDGTQIRYTEGVDKSQAPSEDEQDELWRAYYRSIFNPARLKVKAMQSEMPKKYWKNLPEAEIIDELIATSSEATEAMLDSPESPEKPAPNNEYLAKLKDLGEKQECG